MDGMKSEPGHSSDDAFEGMKVRMRSSGSGSPSSTSSSSECSSNDDSSDFEDSSDAMLGGLRLGMRSIRKNARKELGKCETVVVHADMKRRLETSTLRLLQGEGMLLETSRIVAGIVDDICSDPDCPHSDTEDENGNQKIGATRQNMRHNEDKPRPTLPDAHQLVLDQVKMAQLFESRMEDFVETLNEENLRGHPQFVALQKEITKGEADFNRKESVLLHDPSEDDE